MLGARTNSRSTGFALTLFAILAMASPSLLGQQAKAPATAKYQFKVGLLPFIDNTGSGDEEIGAAVSRAVQAELTHSTQLIGRVLKLEEGVSADSVDGEKAAEIGKSANVDVVLIGMVLEATSEESQRSVQSPSIFGQSVGGSTRSVKPVVTLQGDLYNVVDGQKIDSIRVTGRASDTKVGADVSTDLGSISTGGSSFQNSPVGKALNNAVAQLAKKIAADQPKMARNQPPGGTPE
jgi:hypothetical protein